MFPIFSLPNKLDARCTAQHVNEAALKYGELNYVDGGN
jgi:hypothetical protein